MLVTDLIRKVMLGKVSNEGLSIEYEGQMHLVADRLQFEVGPNNTITGISCWRDKTQLNLITLQDVIADGSTIHLNGVKLLIPLDIK